MKYFFILCMLFAVQVSYASPEAVNEKDKKDSYSIIDSSQNVGKILVQSKFVGDPILESTKISVQVRCSENYKLNPKKKFQSIQVYDYGKNGILSKWDDKNKTLTVYYRTGVVNTNGEPVIDKSMTWTLPLADACTKN